MEPVPQRDVPIVVPDIASIDAWLVRLPLARPITFASGTWSHWNYVVVRVTATDGRVGSAYTYLGEVPFDLMVTELVAPAVVGAELGDLRRFAAHVSGRAAGRPLEDIVRPAVSLVEVGLWDLAAQAAEVPLWRLLAAEPARASVPVMVVEHRRDGDTPAAFAGRIATLAASGVGAVKIKHYGDAAETTARLDAIRTSCGDDLEIVVDVGWAWPDVATAVRDATAWEGFRLAWIEDPFAPNRVAEAVSLRGATAAPIGVGDGVTSVDLAERLIERGAVDVLRVDITTMDGIAGVERLATLAAGAGVRLSPEVFAEVHRHIATAWSSVIGVEVYSADSGVWSGDVFVRETSLDFAGPGSLAIAATAGSGLDIDWDAVERHSLRTSRFPAR